MSKLLLYIYVLTTSAALLLFKLGSKTGAPIAVDNHRLKFNITAYTVSGIVLYGISFISYLYLISKYNLGYIIPLTTGLVYILIFTSSYFIFNEVFSLIKIAGILLIIIGLVLLNISA